jgi:enoyl-CoA hydratase
MPWGETDVVSWTVGDEDGFRVIRWSAPDRANALATDDWDRLAATIERVPAGMPLLLEGAGRWFSAGFDRREWERLDNPGRRTALAAVNRALAAVRRHPGLTVARVRGAVAGGALALMLEADWQILAAPTVMTCPMQRMGVVPSPRFVAQLAAAVGWGGVRRLLVGNARMDAACALPGYFADRLPPTDTAPVAEVLRQSWPEDGMLRLF